MDDIYRRDSWARLLVEAGLKEEFNEPDERQITRGLRRMAHVNADRQLRFFLDYLTGEKTVLEQAKDEETLRFLTMLHLSLWGESIPTSLEEGDGWLERNPTLKSELQELFVLKLARLDEVPIETTLPFLCPLQVHADYTTKEVLAALGISTIKYQNSFREGVFHAKSLNADLLFVTLNKTESDYSPTTMYEDYAISEDRFHWQSQSTTPADGQVGQRYIHHVERFHSILLFVREDKSHNSLSMPYTFLGPVQYESHEGSRPMSITWRLRHKLPAKLIRHIRRLANE